MEAIQKYNKDSSTPLIDVVEAFTVFTVRTGGASGILDEASDLQLENEFGTKDTDSIIEKIIKNGDIKGVNKSLDKKHYNSRNDGDGTFA